jgi:hypothetical protein
MDMNDDQIIEQSVLGEVAPPRIPGGKWRVGADGVPRALPGVGGITYNLKVGHSALRWAADHVEPGVSIRAEKKQANTALNTLACVGNTAKVVSGEARGEEGVVTGKHGGIEHVLVDFPQPTLEKLVIGDKIQVRARGLGLEFTGFGGVRVMNLDPEVVRALGLEPGNGRVRVPVSHTVPGELMGSGLGRSQAFSGDYDIQLADPETVREQGLEDLRIGDLVAVLDHDHTHGRAFRRGAVTVGVVVHSRCYGAGHGPGLTTLLSSGEGGIEPVKDEDANLALLLRIGTERPAEEAPAE